ncbi:toll/interleukin-1 receptor domain-containing protein [Paludisphaera rhizosphaerae]|uniref:toll/interleukin-1 receptor domain-containing protein n=1 Tax=Paludisphaera rhizosphaerae TaxID=2711216 RepID=UPI0013EB0051|nr:toll/interleukin-1 receptor domain-containing protein [Paludisphaera rhizosphaerae]
MSIDYEWDFFISHASEDKEEFVRPFVKRLRRSRVKVWYDEFTLGWGDSLRASIDRGLRDSRIGIVVLSPDFFRKDWPRDELDGLVAGGKRILTVWHKVTKADVYRYSPMLAGKLGRSSTLGINELAKQAIAVLGPTRVEFERDVFSLIERLQSGESISTCVASGLKLAHKAGEKGKDLAAFCTNEINGWNPTAACRHRTVPFYATFEMLNLADLRWQGDVGRALQYMAADPNRFKRVSLTMRGPILGIEADANRPHPMNSLATKTVPANMFFPLVRVEDFNRAVYLYADGESYQKIVRQTAAELTRRLSMMLPKRKSG